MANVRCPMCGKSNPSELEECQFCGARLKPLLSPSQDNAEPIRPGDQPIKRDTAEFEKVKLPDSGPIHAGEAPTKKDTGELEKALPSWLRSVRQGDSAAVSEPPVASPPSKKGPVSPASAAEPDWLSGLGRAASEEQEAVPDWLAELRAGGESESGGLTGTPEEAAGSLETGNADWLSRLGGEPEGEKPAQPTATAPLSSPAVDNSPDWLQSLQAQSAGTDQPAAPSAGGEESPDWLSSLSSVPALPTEPEAPLPAENLPGWLSAPEGGSETPPAAPAESVPGWLSDLEGRAGAGPGTTAGGDVGGEAPASADASAGTPGWLSQMQADYGTGEAGQEPKSGYEPAPPKPSADDKASGALPDWLAGIGPTSPASSDSGAALSRDESAVPAPGSQAAFSMENPDWLSQLKPEKGAESEGEATPENLEAGELPSWVQAMRPVEAVVGEAKSAAADVNQAAETSGPLAGLQGVIPAGPGLGHLRKPPSYSSKLQVSENQQKYATFLERMVMEEADAKEATGRRLASSRIWRWLIAVLLTVAVSLPLVTTLSIAPDWPLSSSDKGATTTLIDALPASAPVLVAFDYDPALSGELEAVAAPVLDHLLARGPRLSVISTNPTGMVLADHFFANTPLMNVYQYRSGEQYASLGYLPGGAAGLADFAANPSGAIQDPEFVKTPAWESSFLQGVTRLSDFGAIVVLTDNADTGRAWVEQTRQALGNTPLIMVVSAQAQPMMQPYFDSGQVKGLVTGLLDAKIYEQGYARPGSAKSYWDSFSVGILAVGLLIICGASWNALAGWQARRSKSGGES